MYQFVLKLQKIEDLFFDENEMQGKIKEYFVLI